MRDVAFFSCHPATATIEFQLSDNFTALGVGWAEQGHAHANGAGCRPGRGWFLDGARRVRCGEGGGSVTTRREVDAW